MKNIKRLHVDWLHCKYFKKIAVKSSLFCWLRCVSENQRSEASCEWANIIVFDGLRFHALLFFANHAICRPGDKRILHRGRVTQADTTPYADQETRYGGGVRWRGAKHRTRRLIQARVSGFHEFDRSGVLSNMNQEWWLEVKRWGGEDLESDEPGAEDSEVVRCGCDWLEYDNKATGLTKPRRLATPSSALNRHRLLRRIVLGGEKPHRKWWVCFSSKRENGDRDSMPAFFRPRIDAQQI